SHPGAEFGYVLDGALCLTLNGERLEVQKGDAFFVPDGVTHSYGPGFTVLARVLLFRMA
ncbi:MAG: cupin domain-containing protein, partial [Armatimonadota bacterium]